MDNISICGVNCATCKDFDTNCKGCNAIRGKVYWAPYMNLDSCPMYRCCKNEKHKSHCGQCNELPCSLYFETRDPSVSEAEHKAGISQRVEILKTLKL